MFMNLLSFLSYIYEALTKHPGLDVSLPLAHSFGVQELGVSICWASHEGLRTCQLLGENWGG